MADQKISALTALAGTSLDRANDLFPVVDTSANATKNMTPDALRTGLFLGAKVKKASDQTTSNYSGSPAMAFDAEVFDDGGWHDTVTNNTRLTVPSGVTRVLIVGTVAASLVTANTIAALSIVKNGSTAIGQEGYGVGAFTNLSCNVVAIDSCTAGDYYELTLFCNDTSITISAAQTFFSIAVMG